MIVRLLLFLILFFTLACHANFDEIEFEKNFKSDQYHRIKSKELSDEFNDEFYYINYDETFTTLWDTKTDEPKFHIGNLTEKNDSTFLMPIDIRDFNFFLSYHLLPSKKSNQKKIIQFFDKTGKEVNDLAIELIRKGKKTTEITEKGEITFTQKIDSISIPLLTQWTGRNHRLPIAPSTYKLKIYLDLNSEIILPTPPTYHIEEGQFFVFFNPMDDLLN